MAIGTRAPVVCSVCCGGHGVVHLLRRFSGGRFYLVRCRWSPMKGMGLFLEAAKALLASPGPLRESAYFMIAGGSMSAWEREATLRLIDSYDFPPDRVHLLSASDAAAEQPRHHGAADQQARPDGSVAGSSFVSSSNIPSTLMCMDVLVAPYVSPSCETLGIAVLEAMAMQRTVVHLGVGGLQVL